MTKYLVKKEFISRLSQDAHGTAHYDVGGSIEPSSVTLGDQRLLDELEKYGFIEEVKEDKRWRGDGPFYHVDEFFTVCEFKGATQPIWDDEYSTGNFFKSRETAEKVAEALRLFFEYIHEPYESLKDVADRMDLTEAIHNARKAVTEDDKTQ